MRKLLPVVHCFLYNTSTIDIPTHVVEACRLYVPVYYILETLDGIGKGAHLRPGAVLHIYVFRTLDVSLCVFSRRACWGNTSTVFQEPSRKLVSTLVQKASNGACHVPPVTTPGMTWGLVASHRPNWPLNRRSAKWLLLEEKGRSLHARVLWARYVGLIMLGDGELSTSEVFRSWGRGGELRVRGNLGVTLAS